MGNTSNIENEKIIKKGFKENSGITLIALVITIIVLLILAGVTIATLTGDNGLLTKAGQAKNASEQANLEEEVQLALIEGQTDKYFNSNSNMEEKLKAIFEKSYGQGNIDVTKAGKNYKVKVKDSKTAYRVRYDGKVEKYEEMDPTSIYARLDDEGTLYFRATMREGYNKYISSNTIQSSWNSAGNASKSSVIKVVIEEPIAPNSTASLFFQLTNLEEIEHLENLHTENATTMNNMFDMCHKIQNLNINHFDTNKVTNMSCMFAQCKSVENLDLSNFETQNVTNMYAMFYQCNKVPIIDVSGFNTSKVTNMGQMFMGCKIITNLDTKRFDTSKVTNMTNMFDGCNNLQILDVSNFRTNNVTNMSCMFAACNKITELKASEFDTNKVANMSSMFWGCNNLYNLELGKNFVINDGTNINDMFTKFTGITITAKQDTVNKICDKFKNFKEENFNIIN